MVVFLKAISSNSQIKVSKESDAYSENKLEIVGLSWQICNYFYWQLR